MSLQDHNKYISYWEAWSKVFRGNSMELWKKLRVRKRRSKVFGGLDRRIEGKRSKKLSSFILKYFDCTLMWDLSRGTLIPWPKIELAPPALEGRDLTSAPLGKSHKNLSLEELVSILFTYMKRRAVLQLFSISLEQGSANIFCEGLDIKYFRLWRPRGLCHSYLTLPV